MRHRSHVNDFGNHDTGIVDGSDSGLTTGTRTLDEDLHLAQTRIVGSLCSILGSNLGRVRSVLLGTSETALSD